MAIERELKLTLPGDLPSADVDVIIAHLNAFPGTEARGEQHLINRYFDTPALTLSRAKMALRLRFVERTGHPGQWLQTLKTAGEASGGLHIRHEWEQAVDGDALDVEKLAHACDIPAIAATLRAEAPQLAPLFETNFRRRLWHVTAEGAVIEIAFDLGDVIVTVDGQRHAEPLVEIELELCETPDGTPEAQGERALHTLARQLQSVLPALHADDISKAQRGYRLRERVLSPRNA